MRKYLNKKRKSEMAPKPGLPKKHTYEGTQTKKKDPIRFKIAKCYNERFIYKKTKCLEQHNSLHHSQHGKKSRRTKKKEL